MAGLLLVPNFLQLALRAELSPVITQKAMSSSVLHYGAVTVRIVWSLVLLFFMTNLVTIFFTRMLPHLLYGQDEVESKAGSQSVGYLTVMGRVLCAVN